MDLAFVINHIRNREYMSGVQRDKERIRSTGEVFTPTELVIKYINDCERMYSDAFTDPTNNMADNSMGDGQFLGEVLIRKMERGQDYTTALKSLFGIDYEESNVKLARERILCKSTDAEHLKIVERQLIQADATTYHYRWDGSPTVDATLTVKNSQYRLGNPDLFSM
jgi:hypothetical protein